MSKRPFFQGFSDTCVGSLEGIRLLLCDIFSKNLCLVRRSLSIHALLYISVPPFLLKVAIYLTPTTSICFHSAQCQKVSRVGLSCYNTINATQENSHNACNKCNKKQCLHHTKLVLTMRLCATFYLFTLSNASVSQLSLWIAATYTIKATESNNTQFMQIKLTHVNTTHAIQCNSKHLTSATTQLYPCPQTSFFVQRLAIGADQMMSPKDDNVDHISSKPSGILSYNCWWSLFPSLPKINLKSTLACGVQWGRRG